VRRYLPLVLFVVAFALRFAAARWLAGEPVWDGHYYDFGARRIAEGHGYSDDRIVDGITEWHPWCHYPVGYSAFLGLFYWLFGSSAIVAHFANSLTGAAVVVVIYELGITALGERRGLAAGIITLIHPGLVLYGALVMGEMLAALTVMLALLVVVRRPTWTGLGLGALVLGLGALVRPQALLCAPFLAFAMPGGWRAQWKPALIACVLALAPVLPWSARNCAVMDGCALVSTNAGWNLAIGAFPRATGRFETLRSSDGCREVTGQVQQDRCWLNYGIANIADSPGRWIRLIPAKLSYTFDHESFQVEYLHEARPAAWPEERRAAGRSLMTLFHRLLIAILPLAFLSRTRNYVQLAGIVATAIAAYAGLSAGTPIVWPIVVAACALPWIPLPDRPALPPALAYSIVLVATVVVTHAAFFGEDRYHIVASPALCLLAAAALRTRAQNTRGAITDEGGRAAGTSSSSESGAVLT
jgi:hypothetical protein